MYSFMILPVSGLTQEVKTFIDSKVQSALYHTGQAWKKRAQLACGHLAIIIIAGNWLLGTAADAGSTVIYAIGGFFSICGILLLFSIRCPKCRTNWNTQSAKQRPSDRWPNFLRALQKCPFCGVSGSDFKKC